MTGQHESLLSPNTSAQLPVLPAEIVAMIGERCIEPFSIVLSEKNVSLYESVK